MQHRNTNITLLLLLLLVILCCTSCAARKQSKLKALPVHSNDMATLADMEFNQNLPVFAVSVAPVRIERQAEEAFLQLMGIPNKGSTNVCLPFRPGKRGPTTTPFIQLASLSQRPLATNTTNAEVTVEQHRKAVASYLESQFMAVKNFALLASDAHLESGHSENEHSGGLPGEHLDDRMDSGPFLVETKITSYTIEAENGGKYNSRKPFAEQDGDIQRAVVTIEAKISDRKKGLLIATLPFTHHVDRRHPAKLVNGHQKDNKTGSVSKNSNVKNETHLRAQQCRLAQETLQEAIQTAAEIVTTKVYRHLISHYQAGLVAHR